MTKQDHEPIRTALREALTHSGWTQVELAERSGVNQPKISRYFSGRAQLNSENVERLAWALGLEIKTPKEPIALAGKTRPRTSTSPAA